MSPTIINEHRAGDVVLVDVPYTDLIGAKKRPAGSSPLRGDSARHDDKRNGSAPRGSTRPARNDVVISASAANGFAVDSAVLCGKLFTLHESLIVRTLGRLTHEQHGLLVRALVRALEGAVGPD